MKKCLSENLFKFLIKQFKITGTQAENKIRSYNDIDFCDVFANK